MDPLIHSILSDYTTRCFVWLQGFVLLYTISVKLLKRQQDAFVTCVGYSSVIFGWMAYLAVTAGERHLELYTVPPSRNVSCACSDAEKPMLVSFRPAGSTMSMVVFGMAIPSHVYPWAALVFTSIIIPQASFVGHLAGILAGACHLLITFQLNVVWQLRVPILDLSFLLWCLICRAVTKFP